MPTCGSDDRSDYATLDPKDISCKHFLTLETVRPWPEKLHSKFGQRRDSDYHSSTTRLSLGKAHKVSNRGSLASCERSHPLAQLSKYHQVSLS